MMNTLDEEEERNVNEEPKEPVPKPVIHRLLPELNPDPGRRPSIRLEEPDSRESTPKFQRQVHRLPADIQDEGRRPSLFSRANPDWDVKIETREATPKSNKRHKFYSEIKPDDSRKPSLFSRSNTDWELQEGKSQDANHKPHRLLQDTKHEDGGKSSDSMRSADKKSDRRPSAFDSVLQILRRPSAATLEVFNNLRRGSGVGSRSGSHGTIDGSRRSSRDVPHGSTSKPEATSLVPKTTRNLTVPQNHVTFRRASGVITFNPDQMNIHQKRYIMGLLQGGGSNRSLPELCKDLTSNLTKKKVKVKHQTYSEGNDAYVSALSALYAKVLFVLGIAFPVTEVLSSRVSPHFYQGYYLFLYLGSLGFMTFMYMTLLKDRAVFKIIKSSFDVEEDELQRFQSRRQRQLANAPVRYGSFYLRLGAVAFGIGSMVYSGLEFGQFFELKRDSTCRNAVQAITPVTRMILTLVQMQFIFLNSRQMELSKYRGIARFGLMHMIATNLCEWLYVIVEETKHEIVHLKHLDGAVKDREEHDHDKEGDLGKRGTDVHDIFECRRANVMGSLVQDASPFLFPCTIEYSLICAVIMYEMWKNIKRAPCDAQKEDIEEKRKSFLRHASQSSDLQKSHHHFSVDCSNAHKGLFSGILLLVMTIISLIMFFVMTKDPVYHYIAVYEVNVCELIIYAITTFVVILGGWQMRYLKFRIDTRVNEGIGMDNTLLMWAQSGVYIYCMFSIIACYFMIDHNAPGGIIIELFSLIQTTCQTAFILDATFRRTETFEQYKHKPGRQIVTFLLVANMALWLINTLQKNRAEFRPTHLEFFGVWAWTIITHVSMPLAIFYRFHSTICLFEIWKDAYKFKHEQQNSDL